MFAIIGWGSLIWNPGDLAIDGDWLPDGPMLPVEFARVSQDRRLTLVLVEGVPEQQTLWGDSGKATLEEAARNLMAREGTNRRGIGCWPRLEGWGRSTVADEVIRQWAGDKGLEGAVWTALGPNRQDGIAGVASEQERLEHLKLLEREGRATDAREYFENAPEQVRTPFRELVQRELGWG